MGFSEIVYKLINTVSYTICFVCFVVFCLELLFVDLLMILLFMNACIYEPHLLLTDLTFAVGGTVVCNYIFYEAYMGRLKY